MSEDQQHKFRTTKGGQGGYATYNQEWEDEFPWVARDHSDNTRFR